MSSDHADEDDWNAVDQSDVDTRQAFLSAYSTACERDEDRIFKLIIDYNLPSRAFVDLVRVMKLH